MATSIDLPVLVDVLHDWLSCRLPAEALAWWQDRQARIVATASTKVLFVAFSQVPRHIPKTDLNLTPQELAAAQQMADWDPSAWSLDQGARIGLLLSFLRQQPERDRQVIPQLFAAADVSELVTLYQSLMLFPNPNQWHSLAAEGVRSNMTAVFNAIALHNAYPMHYFDLPAWNQMVLKALFVGSSLHSIWGLDRRANPELARMAIDYVHERWAAQRSVPSDLWRVVGPFADKTTEADLVRAWQQAEQQQDRQQQQALALACAQSPDPTIQSLLASYPDLRDRIQHGQLIWENRYDH